MQNLRKYGVILSKSKRDRAFMGVLATDKAHAITIARNRYAERVGEVAHNESLLVQVQEA